MAARALGVTWPVVRRAAVAGRAGRRAGVLAGHRAFALASGPASSAPSSAPSSSPASSSPSSSPLSSSPLSPPSSSPSSSPASSSPASSPASSPSSSSPASPSPLSSSAVPPVDEHVDLSKLSLTQRGKLVMKKYGWVAVGVHTTVYTTTISTLAVLIHNGMDVAGLFQKIGLDRFFDLHSLNPSLGTLMVAFIATKFTSPIRLFITATLTPIVAAQLRKQRHT